jgi:hypothetical protein
VPSVEGAGYTIEASIPWSALGIAPKENLELLLDLAVDDGAADGPHPPADVERRGPQFERSLALGPAAAGALAKV